ncbi:MAG TPA: hypothetical protein VGY66_06895, partial [Gemmataceae bacterium]|nr:hypothetical protein [Gemmataceae bacterium]
RRGVAAELSVFALAEPLERAVLWMMAGILTGVGLVFFGGRLVLIRGRLSGRGKTKKTPAPFARRR